MHVWVQLANECIGAGYRKSMYPTSSGIHASGVETVARNGMCVLVLIDKRYTRAGGDRKASWNERKITDIDYWPRRNGHRRRREEQAC